MSESVAVAPVVPLFLSVPDAAYAIGVGTTTMKKLIREQTIRSCKIGGRRLVPTDALAELADAVNAPSRLAAAKRAAE